MCKRIILLLIVLSMSISIVFASPLEDYSLGKASVDLTWRNTESKYDLSFVHDSFNKNNNLDANLTVGLGHKIAIQYSRFDSKSKETKNILGGKEKVDSEQVNLMYELNSNFSAIAGYYRVSGYIYNPVFTTDTQSGMQVGILAHAAIAPKTTVWGSLSGAREITNYELGVGYALSKHIDLNVSYRDVKARRLPINVLRHETDLTANGVGAGITYKF